MIRVGLVRCLILRRLGSSPWAPFVAGLAVILPVLLRAALEPWVSGLPFIAFFPALIVATTLLGLGWGLAVLAASALAANYIFQPPFFAFATEFDELVSTACFVLIGLLVVAACEALRRAIFELEARNRREADLNLELQHRVNNNLAVIQGLAHQTARHAPDPDAFYASFSERLLAISEANQVLSKGRWEIATLPDLVLAALKPFYGRGAIDLDGEPCQVPTKSCVPLVLALHELGTNAVKYGALSTPNGRVQVRWTIESDVCRINWLERSGPPVAEPTRQGLGSRVLRRQPGLDNVDLRYLPGGVACDLCIEGASYFGGTAGR